MMDIDILFDDFDEEEFEFAEFKFGDFYDPNRDISDITKDISDMIVGKTICIKDNSGIVIREEYKVVSYIDKINHDVIKVKLEKNSHSGYIFGELDGTDKESGSVNGRNKIGVYYNDIVTIN